MHITPELLELEEVVKRMGDLPFKMLCASNICSGTKSLAGGYIILFAHCILPIFFQHKVIREHFIDVSPHPSKHNFVQLECVARKHCVL